MPVIPSRRRPGGAERGEESPAETADERIAATGRGFLAVLSPSGASAARNDKSLLPLHQLLHLIVPDRTLRGDDDGGGPFREGGDIAADDGGAVGGGLAAEDHAGRLDGGDDFHLDRGGGDWVLREALLRRNPQLDRRAGVELGAVQERKLEVLALGLRRQVVDDDLIE